MRAIGVAFACTMFLLATARADAQTASAFSSDLFPASELLTGKRITEAECTALPTAVWVVIAGQGDCIRYYHSTAGGGGSELIINFPSELVSTNGRGESRPHDLYGRSSPATIQNAAGGWSRNLRMPYLHLGRPGTYGSSGEHTKRRTQREVDLVSAALDAIKARHGYTRLHLLGHSEGGHLAAALLAHRTDIGCVVLASALLSVRERLAELGRQQDFTGNKNTIDPITLVDRIAPRPELRIFVLTDPDDVAISARSQTIYAKRVAARGLATRQIFAAASDPSAHALFRDSRQVMTSCIKGISDDAIASAFENKKPVTPPDASDPPLNSVAALKAGLIVSESRCSELGTAVWVRVDGRGFCVRYWLSTAGGDKDEAMVFIHGDLGDIKQGEIKLNTYSALVTAGWMRRDAHRWSRLYGGPYIAIGRLGAYGSSGSHRDRKRPLEINVMAAALDELKKRHGFKRFHAVGQSGGAHTVGALVQKRGDIGCAVMASGGLSHKTAVRDRGVEVTSRIKENYDPIDFVRTMQNRPGQRMIVLSEPDDRLVSYRSQREFAERVKAAGLPILHITAAAGDENFHGLQTQGQNLAIDCSKGTNDETLVAKYQTKAPPSLDGRSRPGARIAAP